MTTPEIRRRVSSQHHHHDGSIRVVSSSSSAPRNEVRPYTRRKPVIWSSSDEEEAKKEAVVRESDHLPSQGQFSTAVMQLSSLLPSPIIERRYEGGNKARWSDQPFDEEQDVADATFVDCHDAEPSVGNQTISDHYTHSKHQDEPYLVSPSSATITLESIGRSLQWTQKFPQGRHLSRAKSNSTLHRAVSIDDHSGKGDMLKEVRAGLRLLAKQREDVLEDTPRASKWNHFKWSLFTSILVVFAYGTVGLIVSLLTWAGAWNGAAISVIVDTDILILMTVASSLCLSSSIVGLVGSILNSRPILAMYAFLLWPSLVSMLAVGYTSYKRNTLRLDLKLNQTWSRYMDDLARLRVQEELKCCGYYNTIHQATFSRDCYPRMTLPGCKGPLYRFEKQTLAKVYTVIFTIVFVHLFAIAASILCSNHVNANFGKGLTPRLYRLDVSHVRRNAVNIIRMLSAGASNSPNVHHFLRVDDMEPSSEKLEKRLPPGEREATDGSSQ